MVDTKLSSLRSGMVLWDEVAAKDFPNVRGDKMLVSNDCPYDRQTLHRGHDCQYKSHMDIIPDMAAVLAGSIGIASSNNLDLTRRNVEEIRL